MSRLDLDKGKSLRDSVSSEQLDKDNDKDNNKNNKVRPEKIWACQDKGDLFLKCKFKLTCLLMFNIVDMYITSNVCMYQLDLVSWVSVMVTID